MYILYTYIFCYIFPSKVEESIQHETLPGESRHTDTEDEENEDVIDETEDKMTLTINDVKVICKICFSLVFSKLEKVCLSIDPMCNVIAYCVTQTNPPPRSKSFCSKFIRAKVFKIIF